MTDEFEPEGVNPAGPAFALGLQAGLLLTQGRDEAGVPCENCSCGLADDETEEITLAPDHAKGSLGDFNEELRGLLEFYFPQITEDTIVSAVEICADDLPTAHVRE